MNLLKSIAALFVGGLVGVVVYWAGAILVFLSLHGIPLGSAGGAATRADLAANLACAFVAGALAGTLVARLAPLRPLAHVLILACGFAGLAAWGFGKPGSHWPGWFPMAMALVVAMGTVAAGLCFRSRNAHAVRNGPRDTDGAGR